MTLQEIKNQICDLRCSIEELSEECFKLWHETSDKHEESLADYLHYELTAIAAHLSDLEESEEEDTDAEAGDMDEIEDWWCELDYADKSEISNIPQPTAIDGRGECWCEFEDRANKWWNSRTDAQKREIYGETLAWWDKE